LRRRALAASALAALAAAGCGNPGGDLIAIEVREAGAGTPATRLVVTDDGRGSCNGSELERLPSERLLEAREVEREIERLAVNDTRLPPLRGRRSYRAETPDGSVTWSEGFRPAPEGIAEGTLLALKLRRELCPRGGAPAGGSG
jgi:hypothetical protein